MFTTFSAHTKMTAEKRGQNEVFARNYTTRSSDTIAETSQVITPTLLQKKPLQKVAASACTDLARRRGVRAERAALWPLSDHLTPVPGRASSMEALHPFRAWMSMANKNESKPLSTHEHTLLRRMAFPLATCCPDCKLDASNRT